MSRADEFRAKLEMLEEDRDSVSINNIPVDRYSCWKVMEEQADKSESGIITVSVNDIETLNEGWVYGLIHSYPSVEVEVK